MNKHITDSINSTLRDLDPAPETVLTEAERQRADDSFERIVATSSADPLTLEPDRPRWRRWRLLVPATLLSAAVPAFLLAGGPAFASWTPTPEPLTHEDASAAAATCRADVSVDSVAGLEDIALPTRAEANLVAEQRGNWTYVYISGPGAEATCLMRNETIGQDPTDHEVFGDISRRPDRVPTVARDRIVETGSTAVGVEAGWFREGWLTWTYGHVGRDVSAVTVHTPLGFDVKASVEDGRFAAWWPSEPPSSENLDVMGAWSYTVTLADGSTRHATG